MRLADLMINPELVFWDGSILSDRYVLLDMAEIPKVRLGRITEPGSYQILGTKPAVRVGTVVPKAMGSKIPPEDAEWAPVKWSGWSNGIARVGALNGEPVFVNSDWLDRLPEDWRVEGAPGQKVLRIVHFSTTAGYRRGKVQEWTRTIGCVARINTEQPDSVVRAIVAKLA